MPDMQSVAKESGGNVLLRILLTKVYRKNKKSGPAES